MSEMQIPTAGSIDWNELITDDQGAACAFYTNLFGWSYEDYPLPNGEIYKIVKSGEKKIAGIMAKPADMPAEAPSFWGAYVTVEDCDATAAKVAEFGGMVLCPPMDIPNIGRFCTIRDPQGAVISFIQYVPCSDSECS